MKRMSFPHAWKFAAALFLLFTTACEHEKVVPTPAPTAAAVAKDAVAPPLPLRFYDNGAELTPPNYYTPAHFAGKVLTVSWDQDTYLAYNPSIPQAQSVQVILAARDQPSTYIADAYYTTTLPVYSWFYGVDHYAVDVNLDDIGFMDGLGSFVYDVTVLSSQEDTPATSLVRGQRVGSAVESQAHGVISID